MQDNLKKLLTIVFDDMEFLSPEKAAFAKEKIPISYMISTRDGIMRQLWRGYESIGSYMTITYYAKDSTVKTRHYETRYIFGNK